MVKNKMKKVNVMLVISVVFIFASCRHKYTYRLKKSNFSFTIEENDSEDVLVFGKEDSVFFNSLHGQYCSKAFFWRDGTKMIYLGEDFSFKRIVKKNYDFIVVKYVIDSLIHPQIKNIDSYYSFWGNCDQGRYEFNVFRHHVFFQCLKPKEWDE